MIETAGRHRLLSLERVWVKYEKLTAVRDVSLELYAGDLLGLIGPNGAGKTTLLRAITGLQPTTRGIVRVLDEAVGAGKSVLHHVGFTPDTPGFYEELSVRQFLRFIAKGYDIDARDAEERIDFWLEKVWLKEKANQKIKSLSRGMRQRVGMARTLLPNPAVILLDEPSAGLDPAGRVEFRQLLCELREQRKALIVSSHILADMSEYCTHIGILSAGQMVQFGTVAQVSAAADGGRCRYTLWLARPVARINESIETIAGVSDVVVDRDRVILEFSSNREHAAELLAAIVKSGVPVASFAPRAPGLEEAYLRTGIQQVD